MDTLNIILLLLIIFSLLFLIGFGILFLLEKRSDNKLFCQILKWHRKPYWADMEEDLIHGKCSRCGKMVYQDDWGNWNE